MAEKTTWTVDVERDWGGRSPNTLGLKYGIPAILQIFKDFNIKGLFFISTELLRDNKNDIKGILDMGHELGSHGHFHIDYKNTSRAIEDYEISKAILMTITNKEYPHYRAPHFSFDNGDLYANPVNHVSLLKFTWGLQNIPKDPIFYIHPFDIIDIHQDAPNLFCRILYSRPKAVYKNFIKLLERYQ